MLIEILVETDFDAHRRFLLLRIADRLRTLGHEVGTRRISEPPGDADVSFLHVDRSVIAPEIVAPHAGNGRLTNARALDITKRHISEQLCAAEDAYDGPVILKQNLNSAGWPERERAGRPNMPRRVLNSWRRRLPWRLSRQMRDYELPVLPHSGAVPSWVWRSDQLVVERFLPERDGDFFVTRSWVFLGDREIVSVMKIRGHVVKGSDLSNYEFDDFVPPSIRARREALGFDFGKFDYVIHNGKPILLDTNRTPSISHAAEKHPEIIETLAPGIEALRNAGQRARG